MWGKQIGMQEKHLSGHGVHKELIHSETEQSQHHRLNSLLLSEYTLTNCQLTPTFTYRFGHCGKRKQIIKKRLEERPLLLPEAQCKSSSSPSHTPNVTLPQFCPALHSALGCSNGCNERFDVTFLPNSSMPLAFLHYSLPLCPSVSHLQLQSLRGAWSHDCIPSHMSTTSLSTCPLCQ